MAEEMRYPKLKNIPSSDLFPFRFRIHRLPDDREAVTCEEKEEQFLRQLKERGPTDEEKRPGEICRGRDPFYFGDPDRRIRCQAASPPGRPRPSPP